MNPHLLISMAWIRKSLLTPKPLKIYEYFLALNDMKKIDNRIEVIMIS